MQIDLRTIMPFTCRGDRIEEIGAKLKEPGRGRVSSVIDSARSRFWIFSSATRVASLRDRRRIGLGNMPAPRGAPCNRIPGAGGGSDGGEIFSSFRESSYTPARAVYLATAPRGPRDRWLKSQTRPHAPGSVSGGAGTFRRSPYIRGRAGAGAGRDRLPR